MCRTNATAAGGSPALRPSRDDVRPSAGCRGACPFCAKTRGGEGAEPFDVRRAPGAEMRIQVDRVFADASGAIASLEITDVLADQAEQYVGVHSNKF